MFAENIKHICSERGTNLTAVVKEVKGSSSFVTAINNGSLPKEHELIEMARILECTVADFFDETQEQRLAREPQNDDEADILRIYRQLERRTKHEFMAMVYSFENRC